MWVLCLLQLTLRLQCSLQIGSIALETRWELQFRGPTCVLAVVTALPGMITSLATIDRTSRRHPIPATCALVRMEDTMSFSDT